HFPPSFATRRARPPEPPKMNPAFTISGAIKTAFARPMFCCSQVISGSRRKLDSVVSAASTSLCCSDCAAAGTGTNATAAVAHSASDTLRNRLLFMRGFSSSIHGCAPCGGSSTPRQELEPGVGDAGAVTYAQRGCLRLRDGAVTAVVIANADFP